MVRYSFQSLDNPLNQEKPEDAMKQKLSEKITQLRREAHLTQQQLAEVLNLSSAAISKWENGISVPDIETLCAMADYFQISMDTLLGRTPRRSRVALFLYNREGEDLCRRIIEERDGQIAGVVYSLEELECLLAGDDSIDRIIRVSLKSPPYTEDQKIDQLRAKFPKNGYMSIVPTSPDVLGSLLERCLDVDPF